MILHVSRGSGLTQFAGLPVPVQVMFPIAREDYQAHLARGGPGTSPVPLASIEEKKTSPPAETRARAKPRSKVDDSDEELSLDVDADADDLSVDDQDLPVNEQGPKEIEADATAVLRKLAVAQRARDRRVEDAPPVQAPVAEPDAKKV
jgi:hypothetical protein